MIINGLKRKMKLWKQITNWCYNNLYTGIKEETWTNVHFDIETAEGGSWFTSGEERIYKFRAKQIYLLGFTIWLYNITSDCLGLYSDIYKLKK